MLIKKNIGFIGSGRMGPEQLPPQIHDRQSYIFSEDRSNRITIDAHFEEVMKHSISA